MNFSFAGIGICIHTETIDSKTNDIPVTQNIKKTLNPKKTIFHLHTKKERVEKRYYITSLNDIELIANPIRQHWAVERQTSLGLDVNFDEDANLI